MFANAFASAVLDANSCKVGDEVTLLVECTCGQSQPLGYHAMPSGKLNVEGDDSHWLIDVYGTHRYVNLLSGKVINPKARAVLVFTPPCEQTILPWGEEGKRVLTIASSLVRKHGSRSTPPGEFVCQVSRCVCEKFVMIKTAKPTKPWIPLDTATAIRDFLRQHGGLCLHQPGR
jgi:hypothetical protein